MYDCIIDFPLSKKFFERILLEFHKIGFVEEKEIKLYLEHIQKVENEIQKEYKEYYEEKSKPK